MTQLLILNIANYVKTMLKYKVGDANLTAGYVWLSVRSSMVTTEAPQADNATNSTVITCAQAQVFEQYAVIYMAPVGVRWLYHIYFFS